MDYDEAYLKRLGIDYQGIAAQAFKETAHLHGTAKAKEAQRIIRERLDAEVQSQTLLHPCEPDDKALLRPK